MGEIKERLNEIFQKNGFKKSQIIDSDIYVKWIPLLLCWSPDKYLGISELGNWVVEEISGLRVLDTASSFLRVKILLEKQLSEIREKINEKLKVYELDFDSIFPFKDMLAQVIINDSEYWVEQALRWYDSLCREDKVGLIEALETVKDKKSLSQNLRHKVIKELAQIKR